MTLRSYNGTRPSLAAGAYVDEGALVIGDVVIGEDSSLWPGVVVRGDVHHIRIGRRTNVQDGSVLHVTQAGEHDGDGHPVAIGDEVTIGHRAVVHGCTVGNRVLIGIGAVVLDGAVIEDEVMVAAGSLVAPGKTLASGHLYVGSPARQARALSERERASLLEAAQHYVDLKVQYLAARGDYSY